MELNMIQIDNVSKHYGAFQVLTDCSTTVNKGEVVVVCGPSGSGKSTLIKTVNGLEPIQAGRIVVDGTQVNDPKTNLSKLRSRVGMVFQHFELFPHLSITENLALAQEGMTMMCVTHEMGFARRVADRVIFMDAGRIVEDRPKADFFDQPQSERAQHFLARILHH